MDSIHKKQAELMKGLDTEDKLILIANHILDLYPDLTKEDRKWQGIDVRPIKDLDNYSEIREVYGMNEGAYTYMALDRAHDLLALATRLRGLNNNVKR